MAFWVQKGIIIEVIDQGEEAYYVQEDWIENDHQNDGDDHHDIISETNDDNF